MKLTRNEAVERDHAYLVSDDATIHIKSDAHYFSHRVIAEQLARAAMAATSGDIGKARLVVWK
jgi:hypothetical protein